MTEVVVNERERDHQRYRNEGWWRRDRLSDDVARWARLNWFFGGVHTVWMTELLRWIKPRLPPGYRAFLGTSPTLTLGRAVVERPFSPAE